MLGMAEHYNPQEMRHRGAGMRHKLMKREIGCKQRIGPAARAE